MSKRKAMSALQAQKNLFNLLGAVEKSADPINITVNGKPKAVLLGWEEYESILVTMDVLSDPDLVKSLKESEEDIKAGRYVTLEEVEAELGFGKFSAGKKPQKNHVPGVPHKTGTKRA